jgi:hypothetical protein
VSTTKSTVVINLWAGPGAGKSTTAAGLFHLMKVLGLNVELASEYAKDLTWEKNITRLKNQLLVFATQDHRLRRLLGQVDYIITDSPLPLGIAYMGPEFGEWLPEAISQCFDGYDNRDFLLQRKKAYSPIGRNETEHQALVKDIAIADLFREFTEGEDGELDNAWVIPGDASAPYVILDALGIDWASMAIEMEEVA